MINIVESVVHKYFAETIVTTMPIYYTNAMYHFDLTNKTKFAKLSIVETIAIRECFGSVSPYLSKGYINLVIYTKDNADSTAKNLESDFITHFREKCLENRIVTYIPKVDVKEFRSDWFTTAINTQYEQRS